MPTTTRSYSAELVATRIGGAPRLHGVAAPFADYTDIGGGMLERIAPGAFKAAIRGRTDILALVDHHYSQVLGRRANDSLRLTETSHGLEFDLTLPDTTLGRDVYAMASEGLLGGVSIGFDMSQTMGTLLHNRRTLTSVDLKEVSIVQTYPAYPQTTVEARALNDWKQWLSTLS